MRLVLSICRLTSRIQTCYLVICVDSFCLAFDRTNASKKKTRARYDFITLCVVCLSARLFEYIWPMFSSSITTLAIVFFASTYAIDGDTHKRLVPCFAKTAKIDIRQFDRRLPISFINCTRLVKKHVFTLTFELHRRFTTRDQMLASHMVVTLFAGPCSSSTATLNTGRTFPSIHGSLDGSDPSPIASSHLPWNEYSQRGTISYEYAGGGGDLAQLASVLIHVVVRYGRENMINGIYAIQFNT